MAQASPTPHGLAAPGRPRLKGGCARYDRPACVIKKMLTRPLVPKRCQVRNPKWLNLLKRMVPRGGIEPPTLRFSVACSTN